MVKIKEVASGDLRFLEDLVYNLKENYFGVTNQSDFYKALNLLLLSTNEFDFEESMD
jgi:CRISPR/Cas system Type II protein with McrA/HNH and RuvC-like nuclease domain